MSGRVVSLNISTEKGTVKQPVETCVLIPNFGIEGDAHGGDWHRQVSLLAVESVDKMRGKGVELSHGIFAENITTEGVNLHTLPIGTVIQIGEASIEVTQIGKECHKGCEIQKTVGSCIMPTEGIFCKVLRGGTVKAGDSITIT